MGTFTAGARGCAARAAAISALVMGALALSPATAGAGVGVGYSAWTWGNPSPQGNTLTDLTFIGGRGYAVGDLGTALRTDDGGVTWSALRTGTLQNLNTVRELDPNTIIVGGGCTALRSNDGGATFKRLPFASSSSGCSRDVASLAFPSTTVGYVALVDGSFVASADGGQTFSLRTAIPGTKAARGPASPTDLTFVGANTGFVTTDAGQIYTTADGGNSWRLVLNGAPALNGIVFTSPTTGFAVGGNTAFYSTSDGGNTWTAGHIPAPAPLTLTTIRCVTPMLCVIATKTGNEIVRTTDGGTTFSIVTAATQPTLAADFASVARVVAVGAGGVTVLSNDAGATFAPVGGALPGDYANVGNIFGEPGGSAYATGARGALARTTDGGNTWAQLGVPTSENVQAASFPTPAVGYALDSANAVFKTPNAGAGWLSLNTGAAGAVYALDAPTPQDVLLGGQSGIRRSTDGGNSFSAVTGGAARQARPVAFQNVGPLVYAYDGTHLIRSADGGATWKALNKPARNTRINSASFVSASTGYLIDSRSHNTLYVTRDAGRKWSEVLSTGSNQLEQVDFSAPLNGFVTVRSYDGFTDAGFVLRTTDGGRTWRPQAVSGGSPIRGLSSPPGPFAYALDGAGHIFSVAGAGDAGAKAQLSLSKPSVRRGSRKIALKGRLAPALGGEQILISRRSSGRAAAWSSDSVPVASNGTFTDNTRLSSGKTTYFVAQYEGDDRIAGVSSKLLTVKSR